MDKSWERLIKKRFHNEKTYHINEYASIIRKKRKELNLTQEELSKGICSVSYLSKIENNFNQANKQYVFKLMERIGVFHTYDKSIKEFREFDKFIGAIAHKNEALLDAFYGNVHYMETDVQSKIISLDYAIRNRNRSEIEYILNELNHIKSSLRNDELLLFLYYTIQYHFLTGDFKEAINLGKICFLVEYKNDFMKAIIFNYLHFLYARLEMVSELLSIRDEVNQLNHSLLLFRNNLKRQVEYLMIKLELNTSHVCKMLDTLLVSPLNEDDYIYVLLNKIDCLLAQKKYSEAFQLLQTMDNDLYSDEIYIRYLQLYYETKDAQYLSMFDKAYQFKEFNDDLKLFQQFILLFVNQEDKYELKRKMREEILPVSAKYKNVIFDQIYYDYLYEILLEESRYKEAIALRKKQKKLYNYVFKI